MNLRAKGSSSDIMVNPVFRRLGDARGQGAAAARSRTSNCWCITRAPGGGRYR